MKTVFPKKYTGIINIPSSKSDGQRALLAAGLSMGKSILKNLGSSLDELVMLKFIQSIGAKTKYLTNTEIEIIGTQAFPSSGDFNCGESGLSARLIIAQCAAHSGIFHIDGEGSLLNRPMHFFEETLPKLGVEILSHNGYLPLQIKGPLHSQNFEINANSGSQFLSGLLMALPLVFENTTLNVHDLVSKPYVEMTLNTLKQFGIHIEHKALRSFSISGQQSYRACNYSIEGDWSSASYWLVASALGMPISVAGLNLTSLQADRSILDVFSAANCEVIQENDLIKINGKNKTSFSFDATDCPDLFPALTTFAALCPGTSEIKGVSRLQHKESNRGLTLQSEFAKLGIQIDLHDDLMIIHGKNQLIACQVSSHNDHRIAMCLAIAGMFSNSPLEIDGQEAVAKSYPRFWDDLESLVPIIN